MEILGIDVGGTGIKGAPVDVATGKLLKERHRIETPQPATPEAIGHVIKELVDFFEWKGKIGVGFPTVVQNGIVLTAANIDKSWIGISINEFLSKKTGCEVFALNDADAAGVAEVTFSGYVEKKGVLLLLTIGTGVGSALFADGKLIPNTEFGHMEFREETVEKYISNSVRESKDLTWERYGKRFNRVMHYFERLFYPEVIVIGGGISKKMDLFLSQLDINTKVVPAQLMNEAGIIGAAVYAAGK